MTKRKPKTPITVVRTKTGDTGFTWFRGNPQFPKSSVAVKYIGQLDLAQSYAIDMFAVQDFLFALGALFNNPNQTNAIADIEVLCDQFEKEISTQADKLPPLTGFIRTTSNNSDLMKLRAVIRQAEVYACDLSNEYNMDIHIKSLNILSDFIFTMAWAKSHKHNAVYTWDGYHDKQKTPAGDLFFYLYHTGVPYDSQ